MSPKQPLFSIQIWSSNTPWLFCHVGLSLANKFPSFSSFFLTNISSVLVFIASHLPYKYTLPSLTEDCQIIAGNCSPSFSPHFLLCAIFFSPFCLILLKQCCLLSIDDTMHCPIRFTLLSITNYLLDCSAIKQTHQQLCNVQSCAIELLLMGWMCSMQEAAVGYGQDDECFQDTDGDDVNPSADVHSYLTFTW